MRCQNASGNDVPISDGERDAAMQDSRRHEAGRTKWQSERVQTPPLNRRPHCGTPLFSSREQTPAQATQQANGMHSKKAHQLPEA